MGVEITLPKISIVTPSYNQGKYLEKTILSVIEQGYPNLEYIIIDGGSTDESVEIIRKYEKQLAYWVSEPDRGQSHAINKGFARATGEIFGWLNSDDWYHPGALKAVAEAFADNPEAGAVVGAGEMVDEEGTRVLYKEPDKVTVQSLYKWLEDFFWQPSCFFTREAWAKCGQLNEEIHFAMDLDLWIRIAKIYRFVCINEMLSSSLKHENAKTTASSYRSIAESISVITSHGGFREFKQGLESYLKHLNEKEQNYLNQINENLDTISGLKDHIDALLVDNKKYVDELQAYVSFLEQSRVDLIRRLDSVLNSMSWRLTKPIRGLVDLLSNIKMLSKINKLKYVNKLFWPSVGEYWRHLSCKRKGDVIALQVESFDKGGLEEVVLTLARNLQKIASMNVIVFIVGEEVGHLGTVAKAQGIPVILLGRNYFLLRLFVKLFNVKLVSLHYSTFGSKQYAQAGVPIIYTIHNTYVWADEYFVKQRLEDYKYVTRFVAVSNAVRDFFIRKFSIAPAKVITAPNGLDLDNIVVKGEGIERPALGFNSEDVVFLNIASFNWNKFHILMVAAMERLVERLPNAKLLFVGNTHEQACRDYIEKEIMDRGLEKYIQILDFVPKAKVIGLMEMADCFVLPSLIEGWSIAVMEAMYCGLPMILSDVGSARDVIDNNDIGIVIPNPFPDITLLSTETIKAAYCDDSHLDNLEQLVTAMETIGQNRDEWKLRARAGRQRIISNFNAEKMCRDYVKIFQADLTAERFNVNA